MRWAAAWAAAWVLWRGLTAAQTPEERIWNMDFESAEAAAPTHERSFYAAHAAFYRVLCFQNTQAYESFARLCAQTDLYPAQTALQKTVVAALKGEKWTAFWAFRDLYRHAVAACRRGHSRYLGLCMAALSTVPSHYRALLDVFGFEYDLKKGVELLEQDRADFLVLERQAILYYCHKNLTRDGEKAARALNGLERTAIGRYVVVAHSLDMLKDLARAERFLALPTQGFPYLDYQMGRVALYRGEYAEATKKLTAFAERCGGVYHTDALFKAGVAALCVGADSGPYFRAAQRTTPVFDEDRYAQKQAAFLSQHPPTPVEIRLLKARLKFDGGLFDEALEMLKGLPVAGAEQITELNYRKGRIYHSLGQYEHALHYYSVAQRQFPERNLWMKVYSGFHKAQIYEAQGKRDEARREWRACLQYDGYDYQNALEQKVKAALAR